MVRTATQKDLDGVLNIERLSFEIPWNLRSFQRAFGDIFLVEDKVAGYLIAAYCQQSSYMATIKRLAVHPERRRSGIGTALLETGLAILMDQGVEWVMLNVESSRHPALRLYAKYGFRVTYSSFCLASIAFAADANAPVFYTMKLHLNSENTYSPRLSLNKNLKHQVNAILPPFLIEGHDGGLWDEVLWW